MYSPTFFVLLASGTVSAGVGGWLFWKARARAAAFTLGLFMLSISFWSFTHMGSLVSDTLPWLLLFTQLSYISVVTVPVLWFVFAVYYTDRGDLLSLTRVVSLLVVPAVTLILVFTSQYHSLFYTSISVGEAAGIPMAETQPGPWHFINVVYSYILLFAGVAAIGATAFTGNRLYRLQSVVLTVFVSVPWLVNAAFHLGYLPRFIDPTPVALVAVGVPLAVFVLDRQGTPITPVAHERVFRTLGDPVFVVSPDDRVLDSNRTAREVFGDTEGKHVASVLPETIDYSELGSLPGHSEECSVEHKDETHYYLIRKRKIEAGNADTKGYILTFVDVTEQQRHQEALKAKNERLESKNQQLERLGEIASHDMRAPLSTAEKVLTLLRTDLDDPHPSVRESLEDLEDIHGRLRSFADHLPKLAHESVDVKTDETCELEKTAEIAWAVVETEDLSLEVKENRTLKSDRDRLQRLFENLFRNTAEHGYPGSSAEVRGDGGTMEMSNEDTNDSTKKEECATSVRVGTFDGGFYVEDDGPGIDPEQRDEVFEYGMSTGEGYGFGLAIVHTVVEAHGWEISIAESGEGGARFKIRTDRRQQRRV